MKKIRFKFYNEILERHEVETMWAEPIDEEAGIFRLENIPYFVKGYAVADKVAAQAEDGELTVDRLLEPSGNSTLNIVFLRGKEKERVMQELKDLGGEWEEKEKPFSGYYSVNVPRTTDYQPLKAVLTRERKNGVLDFREACLAHAN